MVVPPIGQSDTGPGTPRAGVETRYEVERVMYRDLNLRIPENLLFHLERQAEERGISLEMLCFSLLSEENQEVSLVDPAYYQSMTLDILRKEIRKVVESALSKEEVRKRVNALEFQISRRYIR
jgi:hypothetical protein